MSTVISIILIVVLSLLILLLEFITYSHRQIIKTVVKSNQHLSEKNVIFEIKNMIENSFEILQPNCNTFSTKTEYLSKHQTELFVSISLTLQEMYRYLPNIKNTKPNTN